MIFQVGAGPANCTIVGLPNGTVKKSRERRHFCAGPGPARGHRQPGLILFHAADHDYSNLIAQVQIEADPKKTNSHVGFVSRPTMDGAEGKLKQVFPGKAQDGPYRRRGYGKRMSRWPC